MRPRPRWVQLTPVILATFAVSLILGCGGDVDLEVVKKFEDAQRRFDEKDYLGAAALYQEILDGGVVSGAVLYNLGNAYVKAGERGRAVAAYRQALRYRPRDPYLRGNLASARGETGPSPSSGGIVDQLLFWKDRLGFGEKIQLTVACAGGAFLLALLRLFFPARRIGLRWGMGALLILTLLLGISLAYDWHRYEATRHGVVVEDDIVARKGNGDSYEPALTQPLGDATEFTVVESRGDWLHVRLEGGLEGWIPENAAVVY